MTTSDETAGDAASGAAEDRAGAVPPEATRRDGRITHLPRGLRARVAQRFCSALSLPPNERILCTEVIFQGIIESGAMTFLTVFLVRLGAPNWLVGLYNSLPALVVILTVLPMAPYVQRQRDLVKTVNWGRFIFRTVIGLFALLPLLPAKIAPYVLVGARSAIAVPSSVIDVSFTTILGRATTAERRPTLLSTRLAIHGLVATVFGLLAGLWLDWVPYPGNYQALFVSAFLAAQGSIFVLSRLRLPDQPSPPPSKRHYSLAGILALMRDAPAFRRFSLASFFFRLTMSMPSALYAIYRVRTLGASDSWIGIVLTVERFVSVFAYFGLGRYLARPKLRRWLWLTTLGAALYPLTTSLATSPEMLLIPALCGGVFNAGVNIFLTNTLLQVSPEEERPTYAAANSFLANITGFVAPMLGTMMADATTITSALVCIGALRVAGGLLFGRLGVGRDVEAAQPAPPPAPQAHGV